MATPENVKAKASREGVRWGQAVRRRAIENGRYVAYALARARTAVGFGDPFDASYDVGRHARTHGGATPVAHYGLPEAPR